MIDAMDLALTIVKSGSGAEGIPAFEKKMSERAAGLGKKSVINMEMMFQEAFLGSLCIRYVSGRASVRSTLGSLDNTYFFYKSVHC